MRDRDKQTHKESDKQTKLAASVHMVEERRKSQRRKAYEIHEGRPEIDIVEVGDV